MRGRLGQPGHSRAVKVLAVLVVVGGLLAVVLPVGRVYRQRRAVERVKKLGGGMAYDYQYHGGSLDMSAKPPGPELLRKWLGDNVLATVECIQFVGSPSTDTPALTDTDLDVLLSFPQLTGLSIHSASVGDRALEYVGQLRNLESLWLFSDGFSDAGLERLAGLLAPSRGLGAREQNYRQGIRALGSQRGPPPVEFGKYASHCPRGLPGSRSPPHLNR